MKCQHIPLAIGGFYCSGKSTVSTLLAERLGWPLLSFSMATSDDLWGSWDKRVEWRKNVQEWFETVVREKMKEDIPFIIDLPPTHVVSLYHSLRECSEDICVVNLDCPYEILKPRWKERLEISETDVYLDIVPTYLSYKNLKSLYHVKIPSCIFTEKGVTVPPQTLTEGVIECLFSTPTHLKWAMKYKKPDPLLLPTYELTIG